MHLFQGCEFKLQKVAVLYFDLVESSVIDTGLKDIPFSPHKEGSCWCWRCGRVNLNLLQCFRNIFLHGIFFQSAMDSQQIWLWGVGPRKDLNHSHGVVWQETTDFSQIEYFLEFLILCEDAQHCTSFWTLHCSWSWQDLWWSETVTEAVRWPVSDFLISPGDLLAM